MNHASIAIVATTTLLAGRAAAAPSVDLRWNAAEGCLDGDALGKLVESTLAQPVFHSPTPASATLEGTVVKTGDGYSAHVVLRSLGGAVLAERDIGTPSEDCSRLDESLAVVVAMMIDAVPEPEQPVPPPPRPPRPPRPLRVSPAPPRAPQPSIHGEVEGGGAVSIGLLPDVSPGAFVRGGVQVRRWSVEIAGYGWAPSDAIVLGSGAHIAAWAGELSGCGSMAENTRASLRACVALGAGFTDATPIALQGGAETRQALVYDAVGLDGALRLAGPIWLHLRVGVCNPFVAPSYYFYAADGSRQNLGQPWVLEPTFSIGLGARFGS